jgi:hypothetical protein
MWLTGERMISTRFPRDLSWTDLRPVFSTKAPMRGAPDAKRSGYDAEE